MHFLIYTNLKCVNTKIKTKKFLRSYFLSIKKISSCLPRKFLTNLKLPKTDFPQKMKSSKMKFKENFSRHFRKN